MGACIKPYKKENKKQSYLCKKARERAFYIPRFLVRPMRESTLN